MGEAGGDKAPRALAAVAAGWWRWPVGHLLWLAMGSKVASRPRAAAVKWVR